MIRRLGAKGGHPDGPKIRDLRRQAGLSQRDFAERFAVAMRTLQRAESGAPILPEMVNAIATGLKVAAATLMLDAPEAGPRASVERYKERVRLRRTASAREIARTLSQALDLAFEYDVNPDESTAEDLAEATEIVEQLTRSSEGRISEPASVVRRLGRLNRLLVRLDACGIGFFVGTYWESNVTVGDDPGSDAGSRHCRIERVCRGLLRVDRAQGRYRTKLVAPAYADDQIDRSIEGLRRYGWVIEDSRDSTAPLPAL